MLILKLFAHEAEALARALRRDQQQQQVESTLEPEWREYHLHEARHDQQLLSLLDGEQK